MSRYIVPKQDELYPELDTPAYRQAYESQAEPNDKGGAKKGMSRRNFLKAGMAVGVLATLSMFMPACNSQPPVQPPPIVRLTPKPIPTYPIQPTPTQTPTIVTPANPTKPTPTISQEQIDRQYVSDYVSQLAPELKNYPMAYQATQDQLYDLFLRNPYQRPFGNAVNKQTLEDVRDSMARWLNFQIDIDKKGESLFPLDDQKLSNIWSDSKVRYNNVRQRIFPVAFFAHDMKLNSGPKWNSAGLSPDELRKIINAAMVREINDDVDYLIANHTKVWDIVHNPEKYKGQYGQTPLDAILIARNDKENENIEAGYGKSGRQWSEYGKFLLVNGSLLERAPIILHGYSRGLERTMHEDYVERVALYMSSIGGASYRANGTLFPSSDVGDGKIAIPLSDNMKARLATVPLYFDKSRTGTLMIDPETSALPMIYSAKETLEKDKTGFLGFERPAKKGYFILYGNGP